MEIKKFIDIERIRNSYAETFEAGEPIVVEVKIDGANASFRYDTETDSVVAFSRRKELTPANTLEGFFGFVSSLDKEVVKSVLGSRYIVFGEWLVPHTVQYPKEMYKQFYMYDVYDTEIKQYLPYDETIVIFEKLKAAGVQNFANVLYKGEFKSWEATNELLKANTYGEKPCMEGIVIKRQSRLDSKSSSLPFYIKIVNQQFSEVHTDHVKKEFNPEELAKIEAQKKLVAAVVTERRCQKIVEKLIEDGVIPRDWSSTDMRVIAKNMPKLAYEDCRKEEPEIIEKVENFGKYCSQIAMAHVRALLEKQ